MVSETPTVSVIIPAYNSASTIERAVQSVVGQICVLEIIIIDDKSSDSTVNVVQNLANEIDSIKLIQHKKNRGASAARNSGIGIASGEYLAFLDADDVWLPDKLKVQLKRIVNQEGIVLVTCDSLQLSPNGNVLKRGHLNRVPVEGKEAWKTLLYYNFMPTPTVIVRKSDVLLVGGFNESLKVAEDLDLWIHIALRGSVAVVPDILVHYYDYSGSLMKSEGAKTEEIILRMIEKHLQHNQHQLTADEIKYIYGLRNFEFGLDHFFNNDVEGSIPFFLTALKKRVRIVKSIQYILRALLLTGKKALL